MFGIVAQKKRCSICREWKSLDEFYRDRSKKDGHGHECKLCNKRRVCKWQIDNPEKNKAKRDKWVNENREKVRKTNREWGKKNPDKANKRSRLWAILHPDKVKEVLRKYRASHPEKSRTNAKNRRARIAGSDGVISVKEREELFRKYGYQCLCCGRSDIKLTLDHVIPLEKGGPNTIDNSQPLCHSCNCKKGVKIIDYRP